MARINNTLSGSLVIGTSSADNITNSGTSVTIDEDDGNDYIENYDATVSINAGDGDDYIENYYGDYVSINAGDGDDYIENYYGNYVSINAGAGNDYIENYGYYSTINASAGDDTIQNSGGFTIVKYAEGDGNDIVLNFKPDSDIFQLTSGSIVGQYQSDNDYVIEVGNGSITFKDIGPGKIQMLDANGNLSVVNYFELKNDRNSQFINGTTSRDSISNSARYVTIDSDGERDIIENNGGRAVLIRSGGESDTIRSTNGDYATIYGDEDDDHITQSGGTHNYIDGGDGNDALENDGERSTLIGGVGDDEIVNRGDKTYIDAGDGNDFIHNKYASYVTIKAGNGSDDIEIGGSDFVVDAGDGDDQINFYNDVDIYSYVVGTIRGGKGNDVISLEREDHNGGILIQYASGDGRDIIIGYSGERDTIQLLDGASYTTLRNQDDVIIQVGAGEIILENALSQSINIVRAEAPVVDSDSATIVNDSDNMKVNGTNQSELIINSGEDVTIAPGAGDDFISLDSDSSLNVIEYASGDGVDTIYGFKTDDSLRITDGSSYSTVKSGNDVIVMIGDGSIRLKDYSSTLKIVGGTYREPDDGFNHITNEEDHVKVSGTSDADYIINHGEGVTVQAGAGDDSIDGSDLYGEFFRFAANDGNDTISNFGAGDTLSIITSGANLSSVVGNGNVIINVRSVTANGSVTLLDIDPANIKIDGRNVSFVGIGKNIYNTADDTVISGTAYNDTISNSGSNVTIDGAGGDDLIEGADEAEVFVFGAADGNDTVTNFGQNDTVKLKSGSIQSLVKNGDDYVLTVVNGSTVGTILLQDTADYNFSTVDNILTIDHINRIYNGTANKKVVGTGGLDWITNTASGVTIEGKGGDDTITGSDLYGEMILVASNHGNDVVTNFGTNDTLKCTAGNLVDVKKVDGDAIVSLKGASFSGTVKLLGAGDYEFVQNGNVLTVVDIPTLVNNDDRKKFSGTSKSEYLINTGERVTIQGNGGDDTIIGSDEYGEMILVASNHGDDVVKNFGKNDTIKCTAGNLVDVKKVDGDAIVSLKGAAFSGTVKLLGAADYEFVQNGNVLTVVDIPTLESWKDKTKLSGSSSAEYIIVSHQHVTVDGKGGGDTVYGSDFGDVILTSSAYGSGNIIVGFDEHDTIKNTGGSIQSMSVVGNDVLVSLKGASYSGDYLIKDAAGLNLVRNGQFITVVGVNHITNVKDGVKVSGTSGADHITNSGEHVTVQSNAGNDTIIGSDEYGEVFVFANGNGSNVLKNFGVNDTLVMSAGNSMTGAASGDDYIVTIENTIITLEGAGALPFIYSGSKNATLTVDHVETIANDTDNIKVFGTDDKDYIINRGQGATIQSGGGNDTVEGSALYGEVFVFASNTDDNVVTNFGLNDSLYCSAGNIASFSTVGNDVFVSLKGAAYSGSVTLKDAAGLELKKSGKWLVPAVEYNRINNRADNAKVNGTNGADLIENSGNNVAIAAGGGNDTIYASAFDEIFLFTGGDGNNVIVDFGKGDTLKASAGSIENVSKVGDDVVVDLKLNNYLGAVTLAGAGIYGDDLTVKDNALTIDQPTKMLNRLNKKKVVGSDGRDWITNTGAKVSIQAGAGADTITGSALYGDVFLVASNHGNDVITNFGVNDTLRATAGSIVDWTKHGDDMLVTVKGAAYSSVITLLDAAGLNLKQIGKNLIVDGVNTINNAKDDTLIGGKDGADLIISSGSGVTIQGKGGDDTLEGSDEYGEMFLVASNHGDDVILNFNANDTLRCTAGSIASFSTIGNDVFVSLKGSAYSGSVLLKDAAGLDFKQSGKYLTASGISTIVNDDNNKKVVGTSGDDYIINSALSVSIEGKDGNDTIEGANLPEVFLFSSADGNNLVTNFGLNDTLRMTAGKTLTWSTDGDDAIVTLKGAAYTGTVTLTGAGGYDFKQSGKNLIVDLTNKMLNTADNVKVAGTGGDDYITNVGQGVTVESKGGDDTIYGSTEYGEVFNFASTDGDNVILNFSANDTLRVTSTATVTGARDGADYIVTISGTNNKSTVTLKDVGTNNRFSFTGDGKTMRMVDYEQTESAAMIVEEENYWFDQNVDRSDELDQIMQPEAAVDLESMSLDEPFKPTLAQNVSSARHRFKKN